VGTMPVFLVPQHGKSMFINPFTYKNNKK
jgi:hypothetical protein